MELCFEIESPNPPPEDGSRDYLYWQNPRVVQAGAEAVLASSDDLEDLTPAELEARRDHLRALGYID